MPLQAKQNIQGILTEMGMWTLQAFHLITERFNDSSKRKITEASHKNYAIFSGSLQQRFPISLFTLSQSSTSPP